MREIKFRFVYSNGKDSFHKEFSLNEIMNGDPFEVLSDMPMYRDYRMLDKRYQYTGLKDKNGIEIFESDIVRWDSVNINMMINWSDDDCAFTLMNINNNGGAMMNQEYMLNYEIIGNKYENPELLEVK